MSETENVKNSASENLSTVPLPGSPAGDASATVQDFRRVAEVMEAWDENFGRARRASLAEAFARARSEEREACRKWWDEHATEIVGDDSLTVRFDEWLRVRGAS